MANEKIMVRLTVQCVLWSEKYGNYIFMHQVQWYVGCYA